MIEIDIRPKGANAIHVLDRPMAGRLELACNFLARTRLVHQREGTVLVGERLRTEHQLVRAGAYAFDGRKALDAPIREPVICLDVFLGEIEALLQRHLFEVVRAFVTIRAGMIPHPAAGGGAHSGFLDRLYGRVDPHAARLDETRRAGPDHFRHQALGVPVFILPGDRGHVGVAPELQPIAGAERVRNQAASDLAEMRVPVDQPRHDEPHRCIESFARLKPFP